MTQENQATGNFGDFRPALVESYHLARQRWVDATEFLDGSASIDTMKSTSALYDEFEALGDELHALDCQHVEKQLKEALIPLGVKIYNDILAKSRVWKETELARLDEMRKDGVPFKERMDKINARRLQSILLVDKGDITARDIELRPAAAWLAPLVGYDRLKEQGVTDYVTRNFSLMFNIKKA